MIRVVLDTNVLISALLQPQGLPAQVLLVTRAGSAARLCLSGQVYAEYEEVIRRPASSGARVKSQIRFEASGMRVCGSSRPAQYELALIRTTIFSWSAPTQPAPIYLVTGNLKHFPAKWADTLIVTPHQFLDTLAQIQDEPDERQI
jgi:uncharacterized protein